jgi:UDP-4-amino-4,6-dideoxy-N-acetyl-beta-L-altrosamine transaminase
MKRIIPYGRQNITDEDIQAVVDVLKSDFLTQGPKIKEFEDAFAKYIGSKYAMAVANGTAALHLCTLALDVKPGDKVITTPITFAASANCVRYAGGDVVFADIDPETYLLDIKEVEKLLKAAPKGTYKGIIPVDFAGRAVDLEAFRKLADEYGCWIIEDACHAPGGYFVDSKGQKQKCGNGNFADLAIFSFHPVKHIACGEGGMITTNDEDLYKKLLLLRTHGITREQEAFKNTVEFASGSEQSTVNSEPFTVHRSQITDYPGWYMEMQALGYNYRLTDFQAALGLSQLKRADEGLQKRKEITARYDDNFKKLPITQHRLPITDEGHAYHLYIIETEKRKELYDYLRKHNIFAQVHYIPVHLMPYYRHFGWKEGDLPNAEKYYNHCLSLPMYPTLSEEEQTFVIKTISNFF